MARQSALRERAAQDIALENPDMRDFAYWEIDLSATLNADKTPAFPQLGGKHTPLWSIEFTPPTKGEDNQGDNDKAARIETYAAKVAAGQSLFDEDDTPPDGSWASFFGGMTPTAVMKLRRE